jgi:hypothetical protein
MGYILVKNKYYKYNERFFLFPFLYFRFRKSHYFLLSTVQDQREAEMIAVIESSHHN